MSKALGLKPTNTGNRKLQMTYKGFIILRATLNKISGKEIKGLYIATSCTGSGVIVSDELSSLSGMIDIATDA